MARYSESEAQKFIGYITPIIVAEGKKRGYKVFSTTIAQAIIEGSCGKSALASPPHHNHFGLKCGKAWLKAGKPSVNFKTNEEYTPGVLARISDYFRSYPGGDKQGVEGYYNFISTKRYANLKVAKSYREFAEFLKKDGYATSSRYVNTLCQTVEKYHLSIWDEQYTVEYFPTTKGFTSIVEALDSLGVDSSRKFRKIIYDRNFSDGYKYSAKQNTDMLDLLAKGRLIKP